MTGLWDSREDFMPLMCGHASGYTTQTTHVNCLWSSLELLSTTRSVFHQCVLYYVSKKFCFHELHKNVSHSLCRGGIGMLHETQIKFSRVLYSEFLPWLEKTAN